MFLVHLILELFPIACCALIVRTQGEEQLTFAGLLATTIPP